MAVALVFHVMLFEGISSVLPLVPQSVSLTLMVLLLAALSLKACDGCALIFSFLCFSRIKALIFALYSFCIFIVIMEVVLSSFEFVFSPSDLSIGE